MTARPLQSIRVLDFSTLLPGPMCTLLLAEAGAEVIKVERAMGDEMRAYEPKFDEDSVNFVLLNRGKKSVVADLKSPETQARMRELIAQCDVVVEQFRPGVMDRLGLGFANACEANPRIVYCSITGYGQDGPAALVAAHDLNYQARSGMLSLAAGADGAPVVPATLTADLAAGAYPAVINILLALRQRDLDGQPRHLDISMADNLFNLMYWGLGNGWAQGDWPGPGTDLVTGGSPRYQVYRTSDGRWLAAAPLEDKFWANFLTLIGLPELASTPPMQDAQPVRERVAERIAQRTAAEWTALFEGHDVCVSVVAGLGEAVRDPHFIARGLFEHKVSKGGQAMTAVPVPVSRQFRSSQKGVASPALGEHTAEILGDLRGGGAGGVVGGVVGGRAS